MSKHSSHADDGDETQTSTTGGNDTITATHVEDDHSTSGADSVSGPESEDHAAQTLTGTAGDDVLKGEDGADSISALDGNDVLRGDGGADTLDGGAGDDTLAGGEGANVLTGGDGADLFVIKGEGHLGKTADRLDQITDFTSGEDKLVFGHKLHVTDANFETATASDYASAVALARHDIGAGGVDVVAVEVGNDVIVFADTHANNHVDAGVVLVGKTLTDLAPGDFG
ncbi:calcium-binding protein [Phenylobacterium soli]|uniref:calcium-binding protein n=1 Tax=Phenylobacterium soli TaxID=2170551 RepID=UPI001404073E|nr:calcium-binding protein [Phenylobacterium soli]